VLGRRKRPERTLDAAKIAPLVGRAAADTWALFRFEEVDSACASNCEQRNVTHAEPTPDIRTLYLNVVALVRES
jgi:hypothetical protein